MIHDNEKFVNGFLKKILKKLRRLTKRGKLWYDISVLYQIKKKLNGSLSLRGGDLFCRALSSFAAPILQKRGCAKSLEEDVKQ